MFGRVDDSSAYKYIDCFGGGRFLSEEQCLDLLYGSVTSMGSIGNVLFVKATPAQVIKSDWNILTIKTFLVTIIKENGTECSIV